MKNTTTKQEVLSQIGESFENLGKLVQSLTAFEGEGTPTTASKKAPKETAPVVEETEETEGYTYEELNEMQIGDLKTLATENDIEFAKSVKKQPLIKLILASMEEEAEEEEAEDEDEDEVITVIDTEDGEIDLSEMSVAKLKKFAKEYEIELEAKDKDGIIAELVEAFNEEEDEDGEDEESDSEEEDGEELDLDAMDLDELKEVANEYEIVIPKKKAKQKADAYLEAVREAIREELEAEEEEDEEDAEEGDIAEEYGLNEMSTEDLAEILESYELSTKGKKQALIDRIVKGVEDGTIEFDEEEGE